MHSHHAVYEMTIWESSEKVTVWETTTYLGRTLLMVSVALLVVPLNILIGWTINSLDNEIRKKTTFI